VYIAPSLPSGGFDAELHSMRSEVATRSASTTPSGTGWNDVGTLVSLEQVVEHQICRALMDSRLVGTLSKTSLG